MNNGYIYILLISHIKIVKKTFKYFKQIKDQNINLSCITTTHNSRKWLIKINKHRE